ncbi:class I SAM-dependent methyltransferase [Lysobacter solisilvae (ex Woo and Kim 2020)]|uniref:Methyltransferase domain-containing protein n=1 Tax=Agrilutibacter terrestris TaxID=2865112 RepID=A0A7H0FX21_9GAMM|nr:class I SAM-dependent methyltransferase [Lysobacter terrestris]QNP40587.1 methyltransferase domain-containing protein [Lysobacter terrestris]
MSADRNPQAEQMGDESMARNLAHQAEAIWPQEAPLFDRYGLSGPLRILDLGCGTGEITRRLAQRYPQATIDGIDILEGNLALARRDSTGFGERIRYEQGDAFALQYADATFDLVVCRHMSQAVPDFPLVLAEITRVLKPGGWLHLLSEDYGMLHMPVIERADGSRFDPDRFWNENAIAYLGSIGCDGRIGRHSPALLASAGYGGIALDFITVDTLRVPRDTFAGIMLAWRDGYSAVLAEASGRTVPEVSADFDAIIASITTPPNYAVWHVPVVSGRKAA